MQVKLSSNFEEEDYEKLPSRSSILLSGNPLENDDCQYWDGSQFLDTDPDANSGCIYKYFRNIFTPSCVPITLILALIILVVLLPLIDHGKNNNANFICPDLCGIQIIETIPDDIIYSQKSPKFATIYEGWTNLLNLAQTHIDIVSLYWNLRDMTLSINNATQQGNTIFENILNIGLNRKIKIRIAQSAPTQQEPNLDTEYLLKRKAAEIRSINVPKFVGSGALHTNLWIIDDKHIYLGSANMDWRSLSQVKELGIIITNCSCLAKDISKVFNIYWALGGKSHVGEDSTIPSHWHEDYNTKFNINSPLQVKYTDRLEDHSSSINKTVSMHGQYNDTYDLLTYFSSSPSIMSPKGRTQDIDAIVSLILQAEKFVYISVMDYFPLTIYTAKRKYWPYIDDAIKRAAIENGVAIKLLVSWWKNTDLSQDFFLRSLEAISHSFKGVDIQVKHFIVPAQEEQGELVFSRVSHCKYVVTDQAAYIGTSNWPGDYFTTSTSIGLILQQKYIINKSENEFNIRNQLAQVFERDWDSVYSVDLL